VGGLAELEEITEQCRAGKLRALRRATRNLAHMVREEGDWLRSEALLNESSQLDGPGRENILTDESGDPMRAYFTGDLELLASTDASVASRWELKLDYRACVRALRGDAAGAAADATAALATARSTGFHRPLWAALAAAALCRALRGQAVEAAEALTELVGQWRKVAVIPSGEWVCKAAQAAALAGPDPAETLRAPLSELPRHTVWSEAALHTVTGAVALGQGTPEVAGRHFLAAAEIHQRAPAVTDRMLSLALAAAAFTRAGQPGPAGEALAEVRAFAERNSAPVLHQVAGGSAGGSAGDPGR
jgi:hypothetical protein